MLLFKVFPPFRWLYDHTLLTKTYIYCIDKASKDQVHERRYSLRLAVSAMYPLPLIYYFVLKIMNALVVFLLTNDRFTAGNRRFGNK